MISHRHTDFELEFMGAVRAMAPLLFSKWKIGLQSITDRGYPWLVPRPQLLLLFLLLNRINRIHMEKESARQHT